MNGSCESSLWGEISRSTVSGMRLVRPGRLLLLRQRKWMKYKAQGVGRGRDNDPEDARTSKDNAQNTSTLRS